MNLLFAAGDVGGARAILPVARLASARGFHVSAMAEGVLKDEGEIGWQWFAFEQAQASLKEADAVIYATSVSNPNAIALAKSGSKLGKPTLHVLDNWSSYATRIAAFVPDKYAVMDELAAKEAKTAGVPPEIIAITGHPNLAKLSEEEARFGSPQAPSILFVSEPAAQDGGVSKRGYDEAQVAALFVAALEKVGALAWPLRLLPHPREDRQLVNKSFSKLLKDYKGATSFELVAPGNVRRALHRSSHVVGMSSILLYEAWLLGRPTLSLQPGLTGNDLRTLGKRGGLVLHETRHGVEEAVANWLALELRHAMPDLKQHKRAAEEVLRLAEALINP